MSRNLDARLQKLEDARRQAEPTRLHLVFWDSLTEKEKAALEAEPKDKHIVMSWAPEDDVRIILDD